MHLDWRKVIRAMDKHTVRHYRDQIDEDHFQLELLVRALNVVQQRLYRVEAELRSLRSDLEDELYGSRDQTAPDANRVGAVAAARGYPEPAARRLRAAGVELPARRRRASGHGGAAAHGRAAQGAVDGARADGPSELRNGGF